MAQKLFENYIHGTKEYNGNNKSGWAEERSQCWEYLVEVYRQKGQLNNAIKSAHNALIEDERFPSIYINLAMSYLLKKEWARALFWVKLAGKIPQPMTTLVVNPKDLAGRAMEVVYHAGLNLSNLDEAWAAAVKLKELHPDNKEICERVRFTEELRKQRKLTKYVVDLVNYLHLSGEHEKVRPLLQSVPNLIANNPIMSNIKKGELPPRIWNDNEIAIFCGPGFTTWSPRTLIRTNEAEFLGGSEEAVIYLSSQLQRLGWDVTIYADPGAEQGIYHGVKWLPYYEFNNRDNFNILVSWRQIGLFAQDIKAKKKYVWCHDILNPLDFTKDKVDKITKVIVLSKAHRETIPNISDDKILISSNGYFEHFKDIKPSNNQRWMIWSSSYDRGIENLLTMWPDVLAEVPEAQLHIFYGWKLFKRFYGDNPERMGWMDRINKLMKQEGITHHDRVSQPELEKWYKKCGIWAYPTDFYEINCISAIKAQVFGAVPVTMNYAALKETVQYGVKIDGDIYDKETKEEYKRMLIASLKDTEWQEEQRKLMIPWAKKYSWLEVAKQFSKEFESDEFKEAIDTILKEHKEAEAFLPVQLQARYGLDTSY